MRIIARKALADFWAVHPEARVPLCSWHAVVRNAAFNRFADVRRTFRSADSVGTFVVFDAAGFRIVVAIHYDRGKVFVRHVFTHAEYDRWSRTMRRGKP